MKKLVASLLVFLLIGGSAALAATAPPISPIVDATVVSIAVDENGMASRIWATDKGWVTVDADAFIGPDGRLLMSARWIWELSGGSATWTTRFDGTTDSVTLTAPPVKTETVTNTITETLTVVQTVTVTVEVPALLPTLRLVKNVSYLTVIPTSTPTSTITFWGLAPIPLTPAIIYVISPAQWPITPPYPYPASWNAKVFTVLGDVNGYFTGSFEIPVSSPAGIWKVVACQGTWTSLEESFIVLGP